jgi:hypothetical protein
MTHTLAESEMVEQLVTLWRETTQAHFLHALAVPEALVVLRERRERVQSLLPLSSGQEQHPCTALLMDHFQRMLAAELAWIERAIAVLQGSGSRPDEGTENVGNAESRGD